MMHIFKFSFKTIYIIVENIEIIIISLIVKFTYSVILQRQVTYGKLFPWNSVIHRFASVRTGLE